LISGGRLDIKNQIDTDDDETDCIEEVAKILGVAAGIECPLNLTSSTVKPFHDWLVSLPNAKKAS
jgi:hypothetical protein